ncbi:MAG: hypothetical protein WC444_01940 [Candidatus Paceibacterota bacterium]
MKKALTLFTLAAGSIMSASAQTITIGNSVQQGAVNGGALLSLLALAQTIVTRLVPFAVGLAVLAFFWYLIKYIWLGADSAENKSTSLRGMAYSVLALFVMVSIWGLVGFFGSLVGINQGGSVPIPGVPVPAA